ncbi:MAG TPA: hypothetical protein PKK94_28810, partial [Leptospiraceae bacterium]|nr:hypothetical protein [Leptospiraceae bacterium]
GGEGPNDGNVENPEGGGYEDGNPNRQHYDVLQSLGVTLESSASPENGHNPSLENAEKQIADLIKKDPKGGITGALKKALDSISSETPNAEEQKKILREAAAAKQIENIGGSVKTFQDFLNAAEKNKGTYDNENILKVAESVLSKQKNLTELTNSASEIEKILKQKGIDTSEFWKTAAATALKKIESGSPIPKDFMKSSFWNTMPPEAKTAMQNIVANTALKRNFAKQISDLNKLDLNKFLAGYDKLKNTAEGLQDSVPTAGSDLNKALADKAGADFRNKMDKTNGLQDAYNAKQALLEKLKGNDAARKAVESKYKEVEQNVLKERLIQGLEKLKTAEELINSYKEILALDKI